MSPEQNNALIAAFLKRRFPQAYEAAWLLSTDLILPIASLLDELAGLAHANFLALDQLSSDAVLFRPFFAVLNDALCFSISIPPVVESIDKDKLIKRLKCEADVWTLPNVNFTARVTKFRPYLAQDPFYTLKQQAAFRLVLIIKALYLNLAIDREQDLRQAIVVFEKKQAKATSQLQRLQYKNELNVLNDLHNIQQMQVLSIPDHDGQAIDYCVLAEVVGGVTPKLALARLDAVDSCLQALLCCDDLSIETYNANRVLYKPTVTAILKLAKHGQNLEVQREAIALNISRLLGFKTARSIMVSHQNSPALLVLFDKIVLLSEFARGLDETLLLPSSLTGIARIGDKYLNHSTIAAHGEGLYADRRLDSLGAMLAFAYLCNDPDFIGAYNQNKAIIGGRRLYVFDQVVMSDERLWLDTRLNLVSRGIHKYLRHGKGRNKSLIEDASFESKFQSIVALFDHRLKINRLLVNVQCMHHQQAMSCTQALKSLSVGAEQNAARNHLQLSLLELQQLEQDALAIAATLNTRFETMFAGFPLFNGQPLNHALFIVHQDVVKHSLIFEKLMNKPVLFTEEGRPYQHPWTDAHRYRIQAIEEKDGMVTLHFNEIDFTYAKWILNKASVLLGQCQRCQASLRMPKSELVKIDETCIFPTLKAFDLDYHYLNERDIAYTIEGYSRQGVLFVEAKIKAYQQGLAHAPGFIDKARIILHVLDDLLPQALNQPRFKAFVLQFQFELHRQLRIIMLALVSAELMIQVQQVFDLSLGFDRLSDLNQVLAQHLLTGVSDRHNEGLATYLLQCIKLADGANHYHAVHEASHAMHQLSQRYLQSLTPSSMARMISSLGSSAASASILPLLQKPVEDGLAPNNILVPAKARCNSTHDDDNPYGCFPKSQ